MFMVGWLSLELDLKRPAGNAYYLNEVSYLLRGYVKFSGSFHPLP